MKLKQVAGGSGFAAPVFVDDDLDRPAGIVWSLWVVGASLPWLLPTRSLPWTTFYSEFLMAAVLFALLGWAISASNQYWSVSRLVLVLVGISAIPLGQSFFGLLLFPSEAILQVISILAFAIAVSLGQQLQLSQSFRLVDNLFASLVVAAFVSTGLALYQWLALGGWGVLLPSIDIGGQRAVANVGQANNLATLLVWGMVGLWWGVCRQAVGGLVGALGVAFLLLGLVLTGSRTGCIQAFFLGVMVLFFGRSECLLYRVLVVAFLNVWLTLLLVAAPVIGMFLFGTTSREMLSVGLRPAFWAMAFDALALHPLTGYGWNQVVTVHVLFSDKYSGLGEVMGHAHNVLLDLLLWGGVFLGGGMVLGVVWWCVRHFRMATAESHWIILTAIAVFLVHAMLELPHLYTFFYLPVGIMIGAASAHVPISVAVQLPRKYMVFIGVVFASLLGVVFRDYRLIETDLATHRMIAARIAGVEVPESPRLFVLGFLQEALERLRTEPHRGMSDEELARFRLAVERYPAEGGLFRYARSAALNYRVEDARWALQLICNLRSAEVCAVTVRDWKTLALAGSPEMNAVPLPQSKK